MTASADKTVLLAGFGPFGEFTVNPSELIVTKLDGESIGGCRVRGIVLPVVFGEAGNVLIRAIKAGNPRAVICLGLAGKRSDITPERLAVNLDDADIPDNAGNRPVDQVIAPGGPPAYWSTLPVKAMVCVLQDQGLPASLSMSAGTFVCNHVFYRLMDYLSEHPETKGGFIHVPPLQDPATGQALLVQGITRMIEAAVTAR